MKRIFAFLFAFTFGFLTASAEVKWTYDASTTYLTEILPSGSTDTAWQFKLAEVKVGTVPANQLVKVTEGTSTHLDFGPGALPDGAPTIKSTATQIFYNTKIQTLILPETLETIGNQTFQGSKLTSIIIPTSVKTLGTHLFYQCGTVTNICFREPSQITTLSLNQIFNTPSIRWINVPKSVTSFTYASFSAIPNKQTATVVFDGDMPSSSVTSLFSTSTGANYDYYLRIQIDLAGHSSWQTYLASANVTKWANLTADQQAQFYDKFPGEPHPYALVTTADSGMRANSWISENYQDDEYPYDDGYLATMDDTVTTNWVGGNLVYTFTNTGTLPIGKIRTDMTLKQYLVVGGGGAGGCQLGGGGGGGAALCLQRDYPMVTGTTFDMMIGKGGVGGFGAKNAPIKGGVGGATTFAFGSEKIVAYGGGGGAFSAQGQDTTSLPTEVATLASGGGAAMNSTVKAVSGTDYTDGQGFVGGSAAYCSAGGGGGFAGAGGTGIAGDYDKSTSTYTGGTAGAGGHGLTTTIRGVSEVFGAGGGAGGGSFYTGGGSRFYSKEIVAGTADATAGAGGQGATGASAVAAFGGGGGGGGASLSGTTNTGFAGGNGGSGCVILVFSIGVASAQPEVDSVAVTFPDGYTQPQVAVTLGGEGSYAATVTVSCGTGALAQAGTAYECVRTFTSVGNGDVVTALADFYPNPGEQVYVKVSVLAVGAKDVTETTNEPAEGKLPAFVGHGGDPAKIIHVRDGATGKATGRNWADAYPDFRAAIKLLDATRNELWYCGSNTLTTATAETVVPSASATVRGGFAGIEDAAADRAVGAMSTIDGENLHDALVLNNVNAFTVDGFRFVHSLNRAIKKTGAGDLTVENCAFDDNGSAVENMVARAVNAEGDGAATCVTVRNCRISRHFETAKGGSCAAVYFSKLARAAVEGCLFVSNGWDSAISGKCNDGIGMTLTAKDAPITMCNTRFVGNVFPVGGDGDGFVCGIVGLRGNCGGSGFTNCLWACNEIVSGAASSGKSDLYAGTLVVSLANRAQAVSLANCTFAGNLYARDMGTAGLSAIIGTVEVADSIFYGNLAYTDQSKYPGHQAVSDIHVFGDASVNVRYSMFGDAAGVKAEDGGTLTLANCLYDDPRFVTTTNEVAECVAADKSKFIAAEYDRLVGFNAHLRSRRGYVDETTGEIVTFPRPVSPAVDAGDPASSFKQERKPNGGRVNLGFYGNTPWASMSGSVGTTIIIR